MSSHPIDTRPIPWSLRAIGLLFVFLGAGSATGMLADWMRGDAQLNLGFLAIWLGVCLMKRSHTARSWTLVFAWPIAVLMPIAFVVALVRGELGEFLVGDKYSVPATWWASLTLTTLVFSVGVAIILALGWLKRDGQFLHVVAPGTRLDPLSRRSARGTVVLAVALFGGAHAWVASLPDPVDTAMSISRGTGIDSVHFGLRRDELAYAVFEHAGRSAVTKSWSSDRPPKVTLETPDGRRVTLPGDLQLWEIVGDELETSDRRVTREQLDAFLNSDPGAFSIDTLVAFVDSSPPEL